MGVAIQVCNGHYTDMPAKLPEEERRRRAVERTRRWRADRKNGWSYREQWRRSNERRRARLADLQMRNRNDKRRVSVALVERAEGAKAATAGVGERGAIVNPLRGGDEELADLQAALEAELGAATKRTGAVVTVLEPPAEDFKPGVEVEGF